MKRLQTLVSNWFLEEDRLNREEYVHIIAWASFPGIGLNMILLWFLPAALDLVESTWARVLNTLAFVCFYAGSKIDKNRKFMIHMRWAWFTFSTWQFCVFPWYMLSINDGHPYWLLSIAVFSSTSAFAVRSFDIVASVLVSLLAGVIFRHSDTTHSALVISFVAPVISTAGIFCIRNVHASLIGARTNLAMALSAVQEQEQAKDEFIENAAHELRTPVAVVSSLLAKSNDPNSSKAKAVMQQLKDKIDAMIQFKETGSLEDLLLKETVVSDVLEDMMKSASIIASASGLSFKASMMHQCMAMVDERSVQTLVSNLVNNAIKFTSEGEVSVVVGIDGNHNLVIKVTDTGCGIEEAHLERVFSRYYRVPGTKPSGFGIGLSVVQAIVDRYHGIIKVKSVVGKGTAFLVKIPCNAVLISGSRSKTLASSKPEAPRPVHEDSDILLVEDSIYLRDLLHDVLSAHGFVVSSFTSAPTALAHLVSSASTKAILIDVNMPQLNAGRFMELLKASGREIPTAFMSGYSRDAASKIIGYVPTHFLAKPFTNASMIDMMTHLTNLRSP